MKEHLKFEEKKFKSDVIGLDKRMDEARTENSVL